jgi:hypothetical protein
MKKKGIVEKMRAAKTAKSAKNLLDRARKYDMISPKTLRKVERLANEKIGKSKV